MYTIKYIDYKRVDRFKIILQVNTSKIVSIWTHRLNLKLNSSRYPAYVLWSNDSIFLWTILWYSLCECTFVEKFPIVRPAIFNIIIIISHQWFVAVQLVRNNSIILANVFFEKWSAKSCRGIVITWAYARPTQPLTISTSLFLPLWFYKDNSIFFSSVPSPIQIRIQVPFKRRSK